MRNLILVSLLLVLGVSSAWSGNYCKNIEYAEIKDMNKAELIEAYKHDAKLAAELGTGDAYAGMEKDKCDQNIKAYTRQLKKRYPKYNLVELERMTLEYITEAWGKAAERSSK